ncbi:MAG: hypothetical protein PHI40_07535 [Caldisericia bacterium]|nr:hypothetical protein [Caldisericia bacterium]
MAEYIFNYIHDRYNRYSSYLIVWPTFKRGIASIFDLFGALPIVRFSKIGNEADKKALSSDWAAVMNDLCIVAEDFRVNVIDNNEQ